MVIKLWTSLRLWLLLLCFLLLISLFSLFLPPSSLAEVGEVGEVGENRDFLLLNLEGTITAGMAHYLKSGIEEAEEKRMQGIILLLDTPGGLVDATLEMVKTILSAPLPVITYVTPSGAIAASAGSFLLLSGHIAAMTPGTTTGAAKPVALTPGQGEIEGADEKTIRFLAGHIRSIARERGRPVELAETFVTENLTLEAGEALQEGVVDTLALHIEDLLLSLHGSSISLAHREVILDTEESQLIPREMSFKEEVIHIISNPQVAVILFVLGLYGLIFGLNMPGTYLPETIGLLSLILALFGLGMFAINVLGILLLLAAGVFFIAEIFTPTFGLFTAIGTISLIAGAFFLPVEPMLPLEWYHSFWMTVLGIALTTALFFLLVIFRLMRLRKVMPAHRDHGLIGYQGMVVKPLAPEGMVKIRGELWQAREVEGETLREGTLVEIQKKEGMELLVVEVKRRKES